jgi:hypothetical protein
MDIDLQMILPFQIFQIFHRPRSRPLSHLGDAIFFPSGVPYRIVQWSSNYHPVIKLSSN